MQGSEKGSEDMVGADRVSHGILVVLMFQLLYFCFFF